MASVKCPRCGKRNPEPTTFDCQGVCAREHLCVRHFDEAYNVCVDCARPLRTEAKAKTNVQIELLADLSTWRQRVEQLEAQVNELTRQIDQARIALEQASTDLHRKSEKVCRLEQELAKQRSRAEHAQVELNELEYEDQQAQTALKLTNLDLAQAQRRVFSLRQELDAQQQHVEKTEAEVAALMQRIQRNESAVSKRTTELNQLLERVQVLEGDLSKWRLRAEKAESQLAAASQAQQQADVQKLLEAETSGQVMSQAPGNFKSTDIKVKVGRATNVGVVRDRNADDLAVLEKGLLSKKVQLSCGIYIVADGGGGFAAGKEASELAINVAMDAMLRTASDLQQPDGGQIREIIQHAFLTANQAVYSVRQRGSDMGTTIVAALRIGDRVVVGNAGDSRAYLINASAIKPITVDHSLVQRLIDTGQISPAEARTHPQHNLIYKLVGEKPTIKTDIFEVRMQTGDRLLLCSNGLWRMVEDSVIWQTVLSQHDPQMACDALIRLATQAGGEDNITVIVVEAI